MRWVRTSPHICCISQHIILNVMLCSQQYCWHRFSLYEPVEFINTFLKDKLEWNQVTLSSNMACCSAWCGGCS